MTSASQAQDVGSIPITRSMVQAKRSGFAVGWVVDAIVGWNLAQQEQIHAFQTTHVISVFTWVRASLMMGVDAAVGAEEVFGDVRVELVGFQCVLALDDRDARKHDRRDDCTLSPADGTVAPTRVDDAVRQIELEHDRAAMAGRPLRRARQ